MVGKVGSVKIVESLKPLGRAIRVTQAHWLKPGFEILLQLHKPCAVYEIDGCPDCIIIDRFMFAKSRDEVTFPVQFLNKPKPMWIGRGKYRKKAVETVWFAVAVGIEADWRLFCELGARGFAYKGAIKKRRRK